MEDIYTPGYDTLLRRKEADQRRAKACKLGALIFTSITIILVIVIPIATMSSWGSVCMPDMRPPNKNTDLICWLAMTGWWDSECGVDVILFSYNGVGGVMCPTFTMLLHQCIQERVLRKDKAKLMQILCESGTMLLQSVMALSCCPHTLLG